MLLKILTERPDKFSQAGTVGVFMQLSEYIATSEIFDRELKLSWESVKAVFIVERTQDL